MMNLKKIQNMNKQLTFLLSLTFLFLFSGSVYGDDYMHGVNAANKGDYETAYKLWLSSAEQGNAEAQHNLALMYKKGRGVPQDYEEAVKWYRLSAEQGNARSQNNLGVLYDKGQGVLQDYVLAHMWWNLSGSNGHKGGVKNRNIVEKRMTPSQIEKAQEMARNWKPKK